MAVKVAINGFGRIGRNVLRAALKKGSDLEFVAVNDLTDPKTLAHLLRYDSVYGKLENEVRHDGDSLMVESHDLRVFADPDPSSIPWDSVGADIVIEGTGRFRARDDAARHCRGSVKKVIITAPAKQPDITIALGVNQDKYDPGKHQIVSNASCTTNCLAPVAKVLHDSFGIERGLMTTIHAYTNDQKILDLPHKDLRRARAAAVSTIPTSTGAAAAVSLVLPELQGRLDGMAIRVPSHTGSLVDLVALLDRDIQLDEVKSAFKTASETKLKGILAYSEEELVSIDFSGNPHSAIVDAPFMRTMGGNMVKVLAWYDNEWGYSNRVLELAEYIGERL